VRHILPKHDPNHCATLPVRVWLQRMIIFFAAGAILFTAYGSKCQMYAAFYMQWLHSGLQAAAVQTDTPVESMSSFLPSAWLVNRSVENEYRLWENWTWILVWSLKIRTSFDVPLVYAVDSVLDTRPCLCVWWDHSLVVTLHSFVYNIVGHVLSKIKKDEAERKGWCWLWWGLCVD